MSLVFFFKESRSSTVLRTCVSCLSYLVCSSKKLYFGPFAEIPPQIIKDKTPYDEEPLFLYLAHQAVHAPLGVPPSGIYGKLVGYPFVTTRLLLLPLLLLFPAAVAADTAVVEVDDRNT